MLVCDYCKHKMTKNNIRKIKIEIINSVWDDATEREFEICPQCASKLITELEKDGHEAEEPSVWYR